MRVYYDDTDHFAGCLTSLVLGAIIIWVLFWFATIVLYYIFIGIAIVAAILGAIISLKNFIVSLINSISMHRSDIIPLNWKLPGFTYKWMRILFASIKGLWKSNIYTLKSSFQQGAYYRFFSIKRWFYWFVAISVAVFGLAVSYGIIYIHFVLFISVICVLAVIIGLIAAIMLVIAFCDSVIKMITNFFTLFIAQIKASQAASVVKYVKQWGYKGVLKMPKLLFRASKNIFFNSLSTFKNCKFLTFKKWIGLNRGLLIYPVTLILVPLIFVVQIIIQSILYLCFVFVKC